MRSGSSQSSSRFALALLLVAVATINLLFMPAIFWVGDPMAWREESRAMMRGRLAVDPDFARRFGEAGQYFVPDTSRPGDVWHSKYGVANSLMSLPPTAIDEWLHGPRRAGEQPDLLVFNLYQVVLTLLVCAALFQLAGRYTPRTSTRVVYVAAVLYATFLWYFQRAQSSEIYQVLFYTCWFGSLVAFAAPSGANADEPIDRRRQLALLTAWLFAGLLLMTRVLYGLLIPITIGACAIPLYEQARRNGWRSVVRSVPVLVLPPLLLVSFLGWVNWTKFGSPWLTGYHMWHPEVHWPALGYWEGVYGFVFDMRGSILLYFPIVIFAVGAARRFFNAHRVDAMLMWASFGVFFLFLGKTPTWLGNWTYGPRYTVALLPVFSLPFVVWIDRLFDEPRRARTWFAAAATVATLAYSAYLTERQNRLDFFVHLRVSDELAAFPTPLTTRYFLGHHQGWISADLFAHRRHVDQLTFMTDARKEMSVTELTDFRRRLKVWTSRENYYWREHWPVRAQTERVSAAGIPAP